MRQRVARIVRGQLWGQLGNLRIEDQRKQDVSSFNSIDATPPHKKKGRRKVAFFLGRTGNGARGESTGFDWEGRMPERTFARRMARRAKAGIGPSTPAISTNHETPTVPGWVFVCAVLGRQSRRPTAHGSTCTVRVNGWLASSASPRRQGPSKSRAVESDARTGTPPAAGHDLGPVRGGR